MADYVIAKYIRLSIDDANSDNLSIASQRLLLDAHIAELCIPDSEAIEFVDNGYSGTNFDRPAVQELFELVRQGKINCIIVKDLSRLGRNLIETGYYIERVFPLYRIRFISVSDYHDSVEHEGDTGGMDIAFKFLVHEQYSRDLSKKIKTAKRAKALSGEYIIKNCAFGFKKVGKNLEIDEPAAETVRLIFKMAADGKSLSDIVSRLYADKHPTPSEYKQLACQVLAKDISCLWNKSHVLKILSDEQYTGTYIAGKSQSVGVGSKKVVAVPKSEWIRIPNRHPVIVDKAVFNAARAKIDEKGEPIRKRKLRTGERYKDIKSPLQGKVSCGYCGHSMKLGSTRNPSFHCDFTRSAPDTECYHLKILASELETAVFWQIKEQSHAILEISKSNDNTVSKTGLESQITQVESEIRSLYERYVLGEISAVEYKSEKAVYDNKLIMVRNAQSVIIKEVVRKSSIVGLRQTAENALEASELSRPIIDSLIDKVRVYPDGHIEIAWVESGVLSFSGEHISCEKAKEQI